jgi:AcrR family transcriptional regulator
VARTGKRISPDERRQMIVQATLRLIADHGIAGATTARIAAAVDMSEGTLYRLFGSKQGILTAALDAVYERFSQLAESCRGECRGDAVEYLRCLSNRHTGLMVSGKIDHFIVPLFEFISAPPSLGLHDAVAERQQRVLDQLAAVVDEGKAAGTIPATADPYQIAWALVAVYWAEDLATLIGLPGFVLEGRSRRLSDVVLRCFGSCSACPNPPGGALMPTARSPATTD